MHEKAVLGLVALVGFATIGQWLAHALRIPTIILLLVVGLTLGPATQWLDPDDLLGPMLFPLVSLGAALILFEGGLSAKVADLRRASGPLFRLVTVGLLLAWVATAFCAHFLLGLPREHAALLGAILVVTGPTVIDPILSHARPSKKVAHVLKYEGILNDPMGAVLSVLVFQVVFMEQSTHAVWVAAWGIFKAFGGATGVGLAAAWIYVQTRKRGLLPEPLENTVLLSIVLGSYALSTMIFPDSGLIAVTVMGVALASQSKVPMSSNLEFFEHVRTILLALLFVLLSARIERAQLAALSLKSVLFVLALIVFVRPLSVTLSTWKTDLTWRERAFIALLAPRGIVAAAVTSVFALRLGESANGLLPVTFLTIIACVVVYGSAAAPLAKLLRLRRPDPTGVLIVGANRIARMVAQALKGEGVQVVLVDEERHRVLRARYQGLATAHGRLLSDRVLTQLNLDDMGQLIALTPNEDVNTLAVTRFRPLFGRHRVHQVRGGTSGNTADNRYATELRGMSFVPEMTFEQLKDWATHARAKVTALSDEFDFEDYRSHYGQSALPLLVLNHRDEVRVLTSDGDSPKAGERLVSLVLESDHDYLLSIRNQNTHAA